MTGKQVTVMWLGLLLVVVRLFTTKQWSMLWGTVSDTSGATVPFSGPPSAASTAGHAASRSSTIIKDIGYLPGFGFIK